jgi:peptide/nickel transport system substrate-binding protein
MPIARSLRRAAAAGLALLLALPPATGQELRVGLAADALTLDPHNFRDRVTQAVTLNIHDPLVMSIGGAIRPAIAESFRQIDERTYEAVIREGVTFHSGAPLTIDDVIWSFERMTRPGAIAGQTSPRGSLLGPLASVEAVGPRSVRFTLSSPWPVFPALLAVQPIGRRAFIEQVGPQGAATQTDGAGPFRLRAWNRGDSIQLERHPGYYGGPPDLPPAAGPAPVARATFRIVPETASRVAALTAGELEIAADLPVQAVRQLARNTRARVAAVNGTRTVFVSLNNARPPFNDLRVRQAANHALDRRLILERLLGGRATPVNGVLSPESFGASPDLPEYRHDPARARALLAEAGLAQGIDITLDATASDRETAEVLAQMLTATGIRTRVQVWEGAVLTPLWRDAARNDRQALLTGWGSGALDPVGIFVPTLRTRDRANTAGYSNAEVDRLLDAAGIEPDRERRAGLYRQAEAMVNREAPWIFLWVPQDLYGVSTRLRDWAPEPSAMIYLHRARIE